MPLCVPCAVAFAAPGHVKGIDLIYLTAKDLDTVAAELNGRPRVVLDGQTPAEAYADYVAMTA